MLRSFVAVASMLLFGQVAVGQMPVVENLLVPEMSTSWTPPLTFDYLDIPESDRTVTVPAGTAFITWALTAEGSGTFQFRPVIGDSFPPEGTSLKFTSAGESVSGSWATTTSGGELHVKLQVAGPNGSTFYMGPGVPQSSISWTLVVFPDGGSTGLNCWDLNENGIPDVPDEDTDGNGEIDVYDCRATPVAATQTPFVANLYVPDPEEIPSTDPIVLTAEFVDLPETDRVVTIPAGTAVISWGLRMGATNGFEIRPAIGDDFPAEGLHTTFGVWTTHTPGGTMSVRMQAAKEGESHSEITYTDAASLSWSLVVYPDGGSTGLNCWDLNQNAIPDMPDEDTNADGEINVHDCRAMATTAPSPPIVESLYVPNQPAFATNSSEFVEVPNSTKTVTIPAGTAAITWSMPTINSSVYGVLFLAVRPFIGDMAPDEGTSLLLIAGGIGTSSGSWVTHTDGGTMDVGLEVRNVAGHWAESGAELPITWTLTVYPDPAPCTFTDADLDGDVDLQDFAERQNCFTGPG